MRVVLVLELCDELGGVDGGAQSIFEEEAEEES